MSMYDKAQRRYDRQSPEDFQPREPSDQQLEDFSATGEWCDWVAENRGGMDFVEFEEANFDTLVEMASEWLNEQEVNL